MTYFAYILLPLTFFFAGCSSNASKEEIVALGQQNGFTAARKIIQTATLTLKVDNINSSIEQSATLASEYSGFIKSSNLRVKKRAYLDIKVPSEKLDSFIDEIAKLGKIKNQSSTSDDVTDRVIDIDARMKNLIALRARYRELLEKTNTVEEIISIEKELSKIQTEIDSIEGRRSSLLDRVAMSSVNVTLEQKTIYGPLGYLGKGLLWFIGKLFVIK